MRSVADTSFWTALAAAAAEDAHENKFSSHWGHFRFSKPAALCLFDNHPYNDPTKRDRQLAEFEVWLAMKGIAILARGSYPAEGEEEAGYTRTLIIDASGARARDVIRAWEAIIERTMVVLCPN
jgi:hypothetical protein